MTKKTYRWPPQSAQADFTKQAGFDDVPEGEFFIHNGTMFVKQYSQWSGSNCVNEFGKLAYKFGLTLVDVRP